MELPYRFDTSPVVILILRGMAALLLVIVAGVLASLLFTHDRTAALALFVSGLITAYFARLFWKHLRVSRGTLTRDEVVVDPVTLFGIRLSGPVGRFPLKHYSAVRVERVSPPVFAQGGPHERVSLTGSYGAPDILVARTSDGAGFSLGRELADALGLPYQETSAPY